ncbi:hypothetical protein BJ165DRAFT_1547226 [Panaeolus papilionaceus]|nr:hypothetical protein BJ165DRAFT_1547226 [Panaeolus papilionaceus]
MPTLITAAAALIAQNEIAAAMYHEVKNLDFESSSVVPLDLAEHAVAQKGVLVFMPILTKAWESSLRLLECRVQKLVLWVNPTGCLENNRRLGYYQGGSMGPFSLEGAFILATQLTEINFAILAANANAARRPIFWINGIIPDIPGTSTATGDTRAGIYFVIDVNGGRNPDENDTRNVFVFAMHTMGPYSGINAPNDDILNNPTFSIITPGVESQEPGRGPGPNARGHQRFLPHATLPGFHITASKPLCHKAPVTLTTVLGSLDIRKLEASICIFFRETQTSA